MKRREWEIDEAEAKGKVFKTSKADYVASMRLQITDKELEEAAQRADEDEASTAAPAAPSPPPLVELDPVFIARAETELAAKGGPRSPKAMLARALELSRQAKGGA